MTKPVSFSEPVRQQFGFLADNFVKEVPGVEYVTVVSADGLLVAASSNMDRDTADQFSVLVSMMLSVAKASTSVFRLGDFEYSDVVLRGGFIMFQQISEGSGVAVLVSEEKGGQLDSICFELAKFVNQSRRVLNLEKRKETQVIGQQAG